MPGHDGGTTCRSHFHPIVVPARGLADSGSIPLTCVRQPLWARTNPTAMTLAACRLAGEVPAFRA